MQGDYTSYEALVYMTTLRLANPCLSHLVHLLIKGEYMRTSLTFFYFKIWVWFGNRVLGWDTITMHNSKDGERVLAVTFGDPNQEDNQNK